MTVKLFLHERISTIKLLLVYELSQTPKGNSHGGG